MNENIIEASLQALVDSLEYALLRKDFAAVASRAYVGRHGQGGSGQGGIGDADGKIAIEEHFAIDETRCASRPSTPCRGS